MNPIIGNVTPLSPINAPQEALAYDPCGCKKKTKKAKKRKPRTVCNSGTYRQTAKGVKYYPKRKVPCAAGDIPEPANDN